ncbi:TetR/AcrR family transcriptional regulator [Desertibacillus haloalkaliphilus]|uniref:TetR/AcrR family transcriptional regulator n=1 Tax=Desertibacillus haloalkaliphilus TaxID=1328930 RepID=UPI001C262B44|nr:TetR/AcrR family transcriptional regulator [Desertibacillus haloalkaliphilus]MBU8905960.1 TetR/AcrR family transcriptional regulator [Desertibacillus haloalkaliphilus]
MQTKKSKRERIVEAALDEFLELGFDRATIQAIAKRAGVGKGTTYEYFSSKEELFSEVVETNVDYLVAELIEELDDSVPLYESVRRFYQRNLNFVLSESKFKQILLQNFGKIPEDLQQRMVSKQQQLTISIEKLLEKAIDRGEIRELNPRVGASMLLKGLQVIYHYQPKQGETLAEVIEEQLEIMFRGMRP